MKISQKVGRLERNRLMPQVISASAGGEIAWIFPPAICKKFAGKRIRVQRHLNYSENSACLLWVWKGRGTINGRRVRGGDEFFLTHLAARNADIGNDGEEMLEAFTFFPALGEIPPRPAPRPR